MSVPGQHNAMDCDDLRSGLWESPKRPLYA